MDSTHRKASGQLREAYDTALDPTEWDQAQEEYRLEQEQAAAEGEEDVDELEDEGDEEPAAKGKRKRAAPAPKKDAKKAKTTKKVGDATLGPDD